MDCVLVCKRVDEWVSGRVDKCDDAIKMLCDPKFPVNGTHMGIIQRFPVRSGENERLSERENEQA